MARLDFGKCGAWTAFLLLALFAAQGCATRGDQASAALEAYKEARYGDAELIWLEALAEAEAAGEDDPRLAQSLRMLANLYIKTGRFDEAQPLLERWLGIAEQGNGEIPDADVAQGLEAIAGIHLVEGNLDPAISFYERALEIRQGDEERNDVALAETLERLASCYDAKGWGENARPLYERAVEIRSHVQGAYDQNLPESLHGVAATQHDHGNYQQAENFYLRALKILDAEGARISSPPRC